MLTPSVNDGPRFHSDMPISELTKRDTLAIEASVVSSASLVEETEDRVMHEIWTTPTDPMGVGSSSRSTRSRKSIKPGFEGRPTKGSRPPRVE